MVYDCDKNIYSPREMTGFSFTLMNNLHSGDLLEMLCFVIILPVLLEEETEIYKKFTQPNIKSGIQKLDIIKHKAF